MLEIRLVTLTKYIKIGPAQNIIIWVLYLVAIPFTKILVFLRFSPNLVTTISSLLALLAGFALQFESFKFFFTVLFLISIILDFSDGLIARSTNNVSISSLDYDHISDLFKIVFINLAICFHLNSLLTWIFGFLSTSLFLISTVLNHEIDHARNERIVAKNSESVLVKNNPIFINLFSIFMTYDSHTLLLLIVIALIPNFSPFILIYLSFISFFTCLRMVQVLSKHKKLPVT